MRDEQLDMLVNDLSDETLREIAEDCWSELWHRRTKALRKRMVDEILKLRNAIRQHHDQHADDLCHLDDEALHAAAGLPPRDRRVGDKFEMLKNCTRYIDRRCEGGHWPSYADLEQRIKELEARLREEEAR